MLEALVRPEVLAGDDKWRCDQCQADREATMCTQFEKLPPVFVVQLQRFAYRRRSQRVEKVNAYIEIPNDVAIPEHGEIFRYELKSIVVHMGSGLNKGHYIALLRVCGLWIKANDSKLHVIQEETVRNYIGRNPPEELHHPVPYLLFYERTDPTHE
jgi:ubiquitin C-terminal hydrolase